MTEKIIKNSEFITIPLVWLFLPHLGLAMCVVFTVIFAMIGYLKTIISEQLASAPLLGLELMLLEISSFYLAYTQINVTVQWFASIAAAVMIITFLKLRQNSVSAQIYDFFNIRSTVIVLSVLAALGTVIFLVSHQAMSASVQCFVVIFALLCSMHSEDQKFIMIAYLVTIAVLIIVFHELGFTMVLSEVMLIYLFLNSKRKTKLTTAMILAVLFFVWSVIFTFSDLFAFIYLHTNVGFLQTAEARLFFHFESISQQNLIYNIFYSKLSIFSRFIGLFHPHSYREILSFANASNTSQADWMYINISYNFPLGSIIVLICSINVYFAETAANIKQKMCIPTLIITATCVTHIASNLSLMPFTGLPMPFMSYSPAQIIVFSLLNIMITRYGSNSKHN